MRSFEAALSVGDWRKAGLQRDNLARATARTPTGR